MAFACPHCGRPHASSNGAARAVRCGCGQTLVNGSPAPGGSPPGPLRPPPLPARAASLPASAYDPFAAHHGLLIDERQARALSAPEPFLVPEVDDADVEPVGVAPASLHPPEVAAGREELRGELVPRPLTARSRRSVRLAAALLASLLAAGGAGWLVVTRTSVRVPPAVAAVLDRLRGSAREPGAAEVASALEASARRFRACVQAAERGPPWLRLAGRRVTLYVTVTSSGRVTAPRLEEAELDRSPPGACLKSVARRMAFPARSGEPVEVRIPLELGGRG